MAVDSTIALTTLAAARSQLQIPAGKTEDDPKIERLVNAASQYAANFCDRRFLSGSYTEYFHGRKMNFIMPREWPVSAITSLNISSTRDWVDANSLVDSSSYDVADGGTTVVYDGIFPNGYKNIRLVYTAGYTSVPYDLEHAVLQMVEWWYMHNVRKDIGRTNSSKGDESVGVLSEVPKHILQLLMPYKRVEFTSGYSPVQNT